MQDMPPISINNGALYIDGADSNPHTSNEYIQKLDLISFDLVDVELLSRQTLSMRKFESYFDEIDYNKDMKFDDFKCLLDLEYEEQRKISATAKPSIEVSRLYVLHRNGNEDVLIKPSSISVSITEIANTDPSKKGFYGGSFYYDPETNELSFRLLLCSSIFSNTFECVKSGDDQISLDIHSLLYSGCSFYEGRCISSIIDCRDKSYKEFDNKFTAISSIETRKKINSNELDLARQQLSSFEENRKDELFSNIGEILFKTKDLSIKLFDSNAFLAKINAGIKTITLTLTIIAILLVINIFK